VQPPVTVEGVDDVSVEDGADPTSTSRPPGTREAVPLTGGQRGRKQSAVWRLRGEIPVGLRAGLVALGIAVPFVIWLVAAAVTNQETLVPTPSATWSAGLDMASSGELWSDLWASTRRVLIGYGISVLIGVGIGVLIGSFRSIESFAEPQIGFLRYIPATALLPVFLFWLGIDETPKIALIVVGTVFYNILMSADVARAVPRELIGVSYTLGAGRLKVLRRVILPHSLPGLIDVARINLAAAWLMLVVAELLAAPDGLALRISRAQRFRQVDRMFALLIVFGIIGVLSDLFLRWLRDRSSPWARP
jgi:NitT/TauT family transport system permease protein